MAGVDEQRLAFGAVAELYERARPSYPAAAIDDVMRHGALRCGDPVLEVGAGTGKASALLLDRGLRVLALEPSGEMATVLRSRLGDDDRLRIVESALEDWVPVEPVRAVVSANAWHWVAPELRYARARAALVPGGTLAAIWTFPDWSRCALRGGLRRAYAAAAPGLTADFPMHPASQPTRLAGDWQGEIDASPGFAAPHTTVHRWSGAYTGERYAELLRTHQDHILLDAPARERLLTAVTATIDAAGGSLALPFTTRVCVAVAT